VLQGPGLPRGSVSDLPVSSLDLPPTLLALAGLTPPTDWPGRELTAALAGKIAIQETFAEWSDEESEQFRDLAFRAVRTPTRKLILWKEPAKPDEFYDLSADPAEAHNLATDPDHQQELRELRRKLEAWMERNTDPALSWPAH
jgi:N-acetylglucosamine-6-sulfatase